VQQGRVRDRGRERNRDLARFGTHILKGRVAKKARKIE